MPLPCSGRQLNALGQRLATQEISDADRALFAQVLDVYQAVLDQVERQLRELGFQATTRVKTTGTLRYGGGPDLPDSPASPPFDPSLTRAQAVDIWTQLSDVMAHAEELGLDIAEVQALIDSGTHPDPGVLDDLQRRLEEQSKAAQALATMLGYGGGWSQDNE